MPIIELMRNRLYAGFNLLYEPEVTRTATDGTQREAKFGGSAALAVRLAPNLLIGGEVWYLRHYDSPTLSDFTGDAVMAGPTLYVQFTPQDVHDGGVERSGLGARGGQPLDSQPVGVPASSRQAEICL